MHRVYYECVTKLFTMVRVLYKFIGANDNTQLEEFLLPLLKRANSLANDLNYADNACFLLSQLSGILSGASK
jgi:hypothetical protein